jgi:hypothetical protein
MFNVQDDQYICMPVFYKTSISIRAYQPKLRLASGNKNITIVPVIYTTTVTLIVIPAY